MMENNLDVSVVMPCLNEEATLPTCIEKAKASLSKSIFSWEIVVADNGSTDNSREIAVKHGARVVEQPVSGYGNTYIKGISESYGKYIVMGDSDDSYDFMDTERFITPLSQGFDMVIGNRLGGTIMPGAMPWLHRYIGNPILSGLLNKLYKTGVSDCHCGMRSFTRRAFNSMDLSSPGMEFASEMVIKASRVGLRIKEIPITLHKDGRSRRPHLRSFRDGWRHLKFMLMYSPTYMFVIPGLFFEGLGFFLFLAAWLKISLFGHKFDTHMSVLACMFTVLGMQIVSTGVFSKLYLWQKGWKTTERLMNWFMHWFKLERVLFAGLCLMIIAILIDVYIVVDWLQHKLEGLQRVQMAIVAATLFIVSLQIMFSAFFIYTLKDSKK